MGVPLANFVEVRNDDGDEEALERVAVDEDLLDVRTLYVHVFQLFRRDVFTLGELEDVFCAVNDLD